MKFINLRQLLKRRMFTIGWCISLIVVLFSVSVSFAPDTMSAFAKNNNNGNGNHYGNGNGDDKDNGNDNGEGDDNHNGNGNRRGNPNSPLCSNGVPQCPEGTAPQCMGNDAMSIVTCLSDEGRAKCCDTQGRCDSERIRCVSQIMTDCVPSPMSLPPNLVFYVDAMNIDGSGFNFADLTDTTANWDDLSSRNNDGELMNFTLPANTNSGWDGTDQVCNPSILKFNGANDFVNIGKPNVLNISGSETFSTWVKLSEPGMLAYLFSDFDPNGISTQGSIRVGNVGSTIGYQQEHTDGSTLSFDGTTNLSSNTWYNIVFVRDDGAKTVKLYLDGQPYGTAQSYSGKTVISDNNSGSKTIGRAGSFDGNYVNGSIANVRIFNAALTASQINQKFFAESNDFQNPTPLCNP